VFKRGRSVMLAGVLLVIALGSAGSADDDARAAIRSLLDRQVADWNRGDLDAFLTGYWRSPDLVFQSGGNRLNGWEAVRDRYRRAYQAEGRAMGKLEFRDLEILPLGPDAAFARGRFRLTLPDGQQPTGLFTLILRKRSEGWRIVHDHTSSV
jgi:uncharacterized protein (TIGR02246 family)